MDIWFSYFKAQHPVWFYLNQIEVGTKIKPLDLDTCWMYEDATIHDVPAIGHNESGLLWMARCSDGENEYYGEVRQSQPDVCHYNTNGSSGA